MKVELKEGVKFQPIKIELTIESLEELKALRARTALPLGKVIAGLHSVKSDVDNQSAETQLKNLLNNLKDVTI